MRCPRCYLDGVIMPQLRERFAHAGYWLLNAADYGVPQHRRRVILSAGPAPLRAPPATHADPATLAQASMFGPRLLPWVSMGEALKLSRATITHRPNGIKGHQPIVASRPAPTILAVSHCETGFRVSGAAADLAGTAPNLLDLPASTVLARAAKGYSGGLARGRSIGGASDCLYLATGRRQLTVAECARLQNFPAGHSWQGTKAAQYRQIGNAVPPTLARVVAEVVLAADRS